MADFTDYVVENTKPLDDQGVLSVLWRCGRDSSKKYNCHLMSIIAFSCGGFCGRFCGRFLYLCINSAINEI